MRDCVLKLGDEHPLKLWLKWASDSRPLSKSQLEKSNFLSEIINSRFNLITDQKIRTKVIEILDDIPDNSLYEKVLKAKLYLVIGNVTHADNILKEIVNRRPVDNWRGFSPRQSHYNRLAKTNLKIILEKLADHPADRKVFDLFDTYLGHYTNDVILQEVVQDFKHEQFSSRLDFEHTLRLAPEFVRYLRISKLKPSKQIQKIRNTEKMSIEEQMYWDWPFLEIDPVVSQSLVMELETLHDKDLLWFIFLMDNEKLADTFRSKTGKSFIHGRRNYLRAQLDNETNFMLALYKLIEFGDIDQDLIRKTLHFLRHE